MEMNWLTAQDGIVLLNGDDAIIKGGLEAQVAFFTGYPGFPLARVWNTLEAAAPKLAEHGVVARIAVNETIAAAELGGSQKVGVNAIAMAKGVGFLWMLDPLIYEAFVGTGGKSGAMVIVGDDLAAKSTTVGFDTRLAFEQVKMPYLEPSTTQELKDWIGLGLGLSKATNLIVGMRLVDSQGDGGGTVTVRPNQNSPVNAKAKLHAGEIPLPGMPTRAAAQERTLYTRYDAARNYARKHGMNRIYWPAEQAAVGIVAAGKAFADTRQALVELDLAGQVRLLKIGMPFPLDEKLVAEFSRGLKWILVVEEKDALLETKIRSALAEAYAETGTQMPPVYGKRLPKGQPGVPSTGELDAAQVKRAIGPLLAELYPASQAGEELARVEAIARRQYSAHIGRVPGLCPGCSHRELLVIGQKLKSADGLKIAGDIGCYAMGALPQHEIMDIFSSMGQGGAALEGFRTFADNDKLAVMGDGTFIHSGRSTILNAVLTGSDVTYIIVDNSTLAATGHQESPQVSHPIDFAAICRAYGVKHVAEVDPKNRVEYEALIRDFMKRDGVKVIIAKHPCELIESRHVSREMIHKNQVETHTHINQDVCELCYDCGHKTACTALDTTETERGRKMRVLDSSCHTDGPCSTAGNCPAFVKVDIVRQSRVRRQIRSITPAELPEPASRPTIAPQDQYSVFIMGIGGLGVITTSKILAEAAVRQGLKVVYSHRTGLSHKAGMQESNVIFYTDDEVHAPVVGEGRADLYLGQDILEASRKGGLDRVSPDRTRAVINTARTPSALQVIGRTTYPELSLLEEQIRRYVKTYFSLDAAATAEILFGDGIHANILLLGVAYQLGHLPLSAEAIEAAIASRKHAEINLQAFRWGRMMVAKPQAVAEYLRPPTPRTAHLLREEKIARLSRRDPKLAQAYKSLLARCPKLDDATDRTLAVAVYDLILYQDPAYAGQYVNFVNEVYGHEQQQAPGQGYQVTKAVVAQLARLMMPKDEFEVARLLTSEEEAERLAADYDLKPGDQIRPTYLLQVPVLSKLRGGNKIALGPWSTPLLQGLAAAKRWRSRIPRHNELRLQERELPGWYMGQVRALYHELGNGSYQAAVRVARAPEKMIGYADIKLRSIEDMKREVSAALSSPQQVEVNGHNRAKTVVEPGFIPVGMIEQK